MRKVFNFRFFPLCAGTVTLAVIPLVLGFSHTSIYVLCALGILLSGVFLFLARSARHRVTLVVLPVLFSLLLFTNLIRFNESFNLIGKEGAYLEMVVEKTSVDKTEAYGYAVDVISGECYNGVLLPTDYLHELDAGDVVSVSGDVKPICLVGSLGIDYDYLRGARYRIENNEVYYVKTGGKISVFHSVRAYMLDSVNRNFEYGDRGVAAALLFGDRSAISSTLKENFSSSGLSHVLAISGLHFSVIAGIIGFILAKVPVSEVVRAGIRFLIMLFYAGVCEFSPSVVRALVMISLRDLATVTGRRYDLLSAFSFAGALTLIIAPERIVDLSFLMSYSAIFGIIFLYKNVKRLFGVLPRAVGDFIALSLSVNITLLPVMAESFGATSVIFLVSNALVLPLMTVGYVLLLLTLIPGMIGSLISSLATLFIKYISEVASLAGGENSIMNLPNVGAVAWIPFFLLVIYSSEYIFKKIRKRT